MRRRMKTLLGVFCEWNLFGEPLNPIGLAQRYHLLLEALHRARRIWMDMTHRRRSKHNDFTCMGSIRPIIVENKRYPRWVLEHRGATDGNDQVDAGAHARGLSRHVVGISRMVGNRLGPGCFKPTCKRGYRRHQRGKCEYECGDRQYGGPRAESQLRRRVVA